ncbi:WW domain-binding protein 11 [Bacillus rossius redtenbacheri]|uniref:WW domain-binding protein 11 n=1 Tax=Bacillus rossius redtenbacheri TaxID=93214 RepID=UPI002FDC80F9
MGRRSINTTKSGKYMNPTDQARKEARKKELKKNKKQRQMVRAAVLKGKDPLQLIAEMEKIDQMEYNVLQPPPLNEKVLKDKRKKLKETLERVMCMYDKDDPDKWAELKRLELDYEKRRTALVSYAESVRHAQQVQVDDIPLPTLQLPTDAMSFLNLPSQIPLPADLPVPLIPHPLLPPPILKKTSAYAAPAQPRSSPGVPPGPPPELSDAEDEPMEQDEGPAEPDGKQRPRTIRFEDDEEGAGEEDEEEGAAPTPKPTSLQQKMLAMAGQDIDQFMKEMEEVQRKREQERAADLSSRLSQLDGGKEDSDEGLQPPGTGPTDLALPPPAPKQAAAEVPPALVFRPPPPLGVRLPPGPPPGRPTLPPGPPPGLPPRLAIRLPPGPPPGMPPRLLRPLGPPPRLPTGLALPGLPPLAPAPAAPNVLSAAPQLIRRGDGAPDAPKSQGATIEAKPQIRNLSADVTRFLPTALRVKREDGKRKKDLKSAGMPDSKLENATKSGPAVQQTKDDAYMQFMREMEGLL